MEYILILSEHPDDAFYTSLERYGYTPGTYRKGTKMLTIEGPELLHSGRGLVLPSDLERIVTAVSLNEKNFAVEKSDPDKEY